MKTNKKINRGGGKVTWNEGAWLLSPMACGCGSWEPQWFFFQTQWLCNEELLRRSLVLLLLRVCFYFFLLCFYSSSFSLSLLFSLFFFQFLFLIPLCFSFFISSFSHQLPLFCWFPPLLSLSLSLSFFLLPSYVLFGFFLSVSPSSYFFLLFPLLSLLSLGFFFFFYLCSSLFSFSQYHCLSFLLICFPPFCFFFNPPSVRPPLFLSFSLLFIGG